MDGERGREGEWVGWSERKGGCRGREQNWPLASGLWEDAGWLMRWKGLRGGGRQGLCPHWGWPVPAPHWREFCGLCCPPGAFSGNAGTRCLAPPSQILLRPQRGCTWGSGCVCPAQHPPTARVHLLLSPLNFSSETCHRFKQYRNVWPWKLKVPPNSLPPPPQKASVVTGLFNRQRTLCLRTSLRIGPSPCVSELSS